MRKHSECIIGILYDYGNTDTVTASGLRRWLSDRIECHQNALNDPVWNKYSDQFKTPYSLKNYVDKRCRTNLARFTYCPVCGKRIDWKSLYTDEELRIWQSEPERAYATLDNAASD